MPRPFLPPDGKAYLSSDVLFHLGLPVPIRDTYAALRVLAWGRDETPELSWPEMEPLLGKDKKTVYRHLQSLVALGVMRWRVSSVGHIVITFTDGIHRADNCLKIETDKSLDFENSQNRDFLTLSLKDRDQIDLNSKESEDSVSKRVRGNSQKRDKPKTRRADPRTQSPEIQIFRVITGKLPHLTVYDDVIKTVIGKTAEELTPFFKAWVAAGYNPNAITWLTEWAACGVIPNRRKETHATNRQSAQASNRPDADQLARDRELKRQRDEQRRPKP